MESPSGTGGPAWPAYPAGGSKRKEAERRSADSRGRALSDGTIDIVVEGDNSGDGERSAFGPRDNYPARYHLYILQVVVVITRLAVPKRGSYSAIAANKRVYRFQVERKSVDGSDRPAKNETISSSYLE